MSSTSRTHDILLTANPHPPDRERATTTNHLPQAPFLLPGPAAAGRVPAVPSLADRRAGSPRPRQPRLPEWFETRWETVEYRVPDFVAGYCSVGCRPPASADATSAFGYFRCRPIRPGSPCRDGVAGTQAKLER
jgi:hypothetical protein